MKITEKKIKIKDIIENYKDDGQNGVTAYDGLLIVRPEYQREFIYDLPEQRNVIYSILNKFPLGLFYWMDRKDGTYELLDGQQRTVSICRYVLGDFMANGKYYSNLSDEEKNIFLNYVLDVRVCDGTDKEKLQWFRVINIAGEKLTNQELRNAVYHGPWLTNAKIYFSKPQCQAELIGSPYMSGKPIRQDYLERALKWISNDNIEEYMAKHQSDPTAIELWNYYQSVIGWVKATFPNYRRFMKGVDWGYLYNAYKNEKLDPNVLEAEIKDLVMDDEVTNKRGIYQYVLSRDEKYLNLRQFTEAQKIEAYERQEGKCAICGEEFDIDDMDADHIIPWSEGGKTTSDNCRVLCVACNRSNK